MRSVRHIHLLEAGTSPLERFVPYDRGSIPLLRGDSGLGRSEALEERPSVGGPADLAFGPTVGQIAGANLELRNLPIVTRAWKEPVIILCDALMSRHASILCHRNGTTSGDSDL